MIDSQVPSTSSFVEDDLPSVWTSSACKLLISLYEEYQDMFKSPVIKNKTVWEKISGRMQLKGYKFSYTECDQKYRNMKRTYNSHKDNQKKTGRGKKTCPSWYHEMDELLAHKHSINPPKTIELGGAESSGKKSETSNSEIDSGRTNNTEDSSQSEVEDNATECTSPEAGRKKCSSRPNTPESVTKRRNKPNEIVMFLSQRWEEQKKIQEQQHREKMEILKMLVEAKENSSDK